MGLYSWVKQASVSFHLTVIQLIAAATPLRHWHRVFSRPTRPPPSWRWATASRCARGSTSTSTEQVLSVSRFESRAMKLLRNYITLHKLGPALGTGIVVSNVLNHSFIPHQLSICQEPCSLVSNLWSQCLSPKQPLRITGRLLGSLGIPIF